MSDELLMNLVHENPCLLDEGNVSTTTSTSMYIKANR